MTNATNYVNNTAQEASQNYSLSQNQDPQNTDVLNSSTSSTAISTNMARSEKEQEGSSPFMGDMRAWGPSTKWTESMWQELKELVEVGITGEELMEAFGKIRRKDLDRIFYSLSLQYNKLYKVVWDTNYENNEHALPELKVRRDGLKISMTRLKRYGIDAPQGSIIKLCKVSNEEIKLVIMR